jgi:hypothetical protein
MKKILAVLTIILTCSLAFGATGWYNDYITIGGTQYYIGSGTGTALNGASLTGVTSLNITECDMKYWSDTQDRAGGSFFWKVMSSDGNTEIKAASEIIWTHSSIGGNDYQGTWSGSVNVLDGLSGGVTYQLHVWAKSWDGGGGQGDSWLSNGGANYVATFATDASLPVELSSFAAQSSHRGIALSWVTDSEIENQGFIISRKTRTTRWEEIASFSKDRALLGQGSTTDATRYAFLDSQVREGQTYSYLLSDVDYRGQRTNHDNQIQTLTYVIPETPTRPGVLELTRVYPNPFNPATTLSYGLTAASDVSVNIYDLKGELVWNQTQLNQTAGADHQITWQGVNTLGQAVNSGIYLVHIQAGTERISQKVTLLR